MQPESDATTLLFIGTHGHVLALDQTDGRLVWKTSLPSTGYQVVTTLFEENRLLCGTAGKLFALDPTNGRILWENNLPGLGRNFVTLCTARQSSDPGAVLAAALAARRDDDTPAPPVIV